MDIIDVNFVVNFYKILYEILKNVMIPIIIPILTIYITIKYTTKNTTTQINEQNKSNNRPFLTVESIKSIDKIDDLESKYLICNYDLKEKIKEKNKQREKIQMLIKNIGKGPALNIHFYNLLNSNILKRDVMFKDEKQWCAMVQNTIDYNIQDRDEKIILSEVMFEYQEKIIIKDKNSNYVETDMIHIANSIYLLCMYNDVYDNIYNFILKINIWGIGIKYVFEYYYPYNNEYKNIANSKDVFGVNYRKIIKKSQV